MKIWVIHKMDGSIEAVPTKEAAYDVMLDYIRSNSWRFFTGVNYSQIEKDACIELETSYKKDSISLNVTDICYAAEVVFYSPIKVPFDSYVYA